MAAVDSYTDLYDIPQDLKDFRDTIRQIVKERVWPRAAEIDETGADDPERAVRGRAVWLDDEDDQADEDQRGRQHVADDEQRPPVFLLFPVHLFFVILNVRVTGVALLPAASVASSTTR